MPRPQRIEFDGAWYHVMNRSAGRRMVFRGDRDHTLFLDVLGEVHETYGLEVHAYCLLGNHYHLLLRTPRGNLSAAMRHLSAVYTRRFNGRHGTDGALFRGRYTAILIDADAYLLQVSRYIHQNPVAAGLAERPEDWPWSSYAAFLGRVQPPAWLQTAPTLELLGGRRPRLLYRNFVARDEDDEVRRFYGRAQLGSVLGNDRFRKRALRRGGREAKARGLRAGAATPSLERIIKTTARAFGTSPEALLSARRGRGQANVPRLVAIGLARSPGGHPLSEIAHAFRLGGPGSASVTASRLRGRMDADPTLARRVKDLRAQLFPNGR